MDEKPATAEPVKKSRRRWYQFGLRTQMIVVTLLAIPCAFVAWQVKIVRERKRLIERMSNDRRVIFAEDRRAKIPFYRLWLGDKEYGLIDLVNVSGEVPEEEIELYRSNFPEAVVVRNSELGEGEKEFHRRYGTDWYDFFGPMIKR